MQTRVEVGRNPFFGVNWLSHAADIHFHEASSRLVRRPAIMSSLKETFSSRLTPQQKDASSLEISSAVVETSYRVLPEIDEKATPSGVLRILFVSESGVCRSPLAVAAANAALDAAGLRDQVQCAAACTRDYNIGDLPDPAAVSAASALGLHLVDVSGTAGGARQFDERTDIVRFDLVLTMDKFTAADVLREISVFDTIHPDAKYSLKVRLLGEFRGMQTGNICGSGGDGTTADDIDDPLYGNAGGEKETAAVKACAEDVLNCCQGLAALLVQLNADGVAGEEEGGLKAGVASWLRNADAVEWLVPPMLQPR